MTILKNNYLTVMIEQYGAEIKSILDMDGTEYILNDSKYWRFSTPHLFPVVGALQNGEFIHEGVRYPMTRHGFARNCNFDLIEADDKKAVFSLQYNEETLKAYPFKFALFVTYKLDGRAISITYTVKNLDDKEIVFSLGAHPAFLAPRENGELFTDYFLEFETFEDLDTIPIDMKSGLLKRNTMPMAKNTKIINLDKTLFNNDALVFHGLKSKHVSIKNRKNSKTVKLNFEEFPFLGIWSDFGNSPFVCIEPWVGHADYVDFFGEFKEKEDNVTLHQGAENTYRYTIEII